MFGLSAGEILLIAIIALVLFGNEKLPENIKKFVEFITQIKKFFLHMNHSWHDLKHDIKDSINIEQEKKIKAPVHQEELDLGQKQIEEEYAERVKSIQLDQENPSYPMISGQKSDSKSENSTHSPSPLF